MSLSGASGNAQRLVKSRSALWKNWKKLTDHQREKLEWILNTDPRRDRAYLLKEGLCFVFIVKGQAGKDVLHPTVDERSAPPRFVSAAAISAQPSIVGPATPKASVA